MKANIVKHMAVVLFAALSINFIACKPKPDTQKATIVGEFLTLTYWCNECTEWEDDNYNPTYELSNDGKSLTIYGMDDNDMSEFHCVRI